MIRAIDRARRRIHATDPFATPEHERSPVRRFRGRLAAAVTLWTAPGPAGLTVSSTLVADGEPGRLLGLLDDESDLWTAVEAPAGSRSPRSAPGSASSPTGSPA